MSRRARLLPPIALFLLLPFLLGAQVPGRTGNLVTTKWLEANRARPEVLLFDASLAQQYAAKHIPGAQSVDMYVYGIGDQPAAQTERLYQSLGVDAKKTIVLYDAGGSIMATRAFFSLVYAGFPVKQLAILDGGLAKWEAEGLPVTKDTAPTPKRGTFRIAKFNEDVRVRLPEVVTASGDPSRTALVEGLDGSWHFGQVQALSRGGHIPNGILLPAADFYNADRTFKSPDEIRRMLKFLNIRPEQQVYTYCGGGVAASAPFFALKYLAGYPNVKMFVESELGWLADERELPYWTYDAPFLVRKSTWLRSSATAMMRTYLDPRVSIVDVRAPAAYAAEHVAFAVNVPADVFRDGLTAPATLAGALGAAGVDPSHEAVVVSGGGITRESALAFALLEQLGQKRVSILVDSAGQWAALGLPVSKQPTAIGPKKSRADLSIPPVAYPATAAKGAIIADPKSTTGVYPKVFIASGAAPPARALDGKVIHVPWNGLVNADGTPKAAKEIWNVLTKAGVPRFAEIVVVADDPGDAAVNYFVLRLMGYADVKLLI
jgi:3-mercaptopyruvate sulfurtransferase SseA